MPDRIEAVLQVLKDAPTISAKVGARVFRDELPDHIINRMPMPAIVIRPAGGGSAFGQGYQEFSEQRIDIHHYSGTPVSAYSLYGDTYDVLHHLERTVVGDTLLHWARRAGGPNQMREPGEGWPGGIPDNSKHWPFVVASWTILAADIAIGATP